MIRILYVVSIYLSLDNLIILLLKSIRILTYPNNIYNKKLKINTINKFNFLTKIIILAAQF